VGRDVGGWDDISGLILDAEIFASDVKEALHPREGVFCFDHNHLSVVVVQEDLGLNVQDLDGIGDLELLDGSLELDPVV